LLYFILFYSVLFCFAFFVFFFILELPTIYQPCHQMIFRIGLFFSEAIRANYFIQVQLRPGATIGLVGARHAYDYDYDEIAQQRCIAPDCASRFVWSRSGRSVVS